MDKINSCCVAILCITFLTSCEKDSLNDSLADPRDSIVGSYLGMSSGELSWIDWPQNSEFPIYIDRRSWTNDSVSVTIQKDSSTGLIVSECLNSGFWESVLGCEDVYNLYAVVDSGDYFFQGCIGTCKYIVQEYRIVLYGGRSSPIGSTTYSFWERIVLAK